MTTTLDDPPAGPHPRDGADEAELRELFAELDGLWPPPGLLEDTAPGPYLAALVGSVDPRALDADRLVELAAAAARLGSWAAEREAAATVELTARCARLRGVGPRVDEVPAEAVAATELAAGLALSAGAARLRVELADSEPPRLQWRLGCAAERSSAVWF